MSEILIKKSKHDISKTNPSLYENYTVEFFGDLKDYNGRVTVKFKHINTQVLAQCQCTEEDGTPMMQATYFNIFKKCVKEIHGLKHEVENEDGTIESVEMTVRDIVEFEDFNNVSDEGKNALQIILNVVYDTAKAIMSKSFLTEEEEKHRKGVSGTVRKASGK